jgi:hypothetical protein
MLIIITICGNVKPNTREVRMPNRELPIVPVAPRNHFGGQSPPGAMNPTRAPPIVSNLHGCGGIIKEKMTRAIFPTKAGQS